MPRLSWNEIQDRAVAYASHFERYRGLTGSIDAVVATTEGES